MIVSFFCFVIFECQIATFVPNISVSLCSVTVTPHLGANTKESQRNIAVQAAENAIAAAKGIAYPNALNLPIRENELPEFVIPFLELMQKIGYMSAQVTRSGAKSIKVVAEGQIKEYIDSLATFATVGVLSESLADAINYVNAGYVAKEREIEIVKEIHDDGKGFKNRITLKLTTQNGNVIKVSGTVFGENVQRIVDIDGYDLDLEPKGHMILFKNNDEPGVIGDVGRIIAEHNINISDFRLGRDNKGQALAVVRIDTEAPPSLIDQLSSLDTCISVRSVTL